ATEAAKGANLISLVPTLLGRVDASWFRKILLGGSEPPAETPDNVVTTYGMTETCGGVVYNGRPLDGVEIDIGEGGEIRLRCRMLARSYCTDRPTDGPESRFGELPVCDANGWYSTGDCGSIDTNGKLQVNGRITDMIITGGENVWPEPIERVLERRPDISEVAVKGSPDQQWGQRVVAYVVPTKVSTPPTLEQLRETVKDQLPAWYAPKELVLVNEIPRTAIGKVRRSLLGT
ncbi:MAG TPA: hypothetical protein VMU77_04715, partial [Acidimicrobiales bacterium]|nr:hypothetical protein [Acidimicrobiales bacterium]